MKEPHISMSVVRRLPRYYRFLCELVDSGTAHISSKELADRMGLTASQVRQDLNCFGGFGQQGYGYLTARLRQEIGVILGLDACRPTVLLGAGNIGRGIANHMDFPRYGLNLCAVLDRNPALAGQILSGLPIRSTDELEIICAEKQVQLAVLCVPKEAAPPLVSRLLACGVRGFWNFSHYDIAHHHPGAISENVHLGDSLMTLSYQMQNHPDPSSDNPDGQ